MKEPIPTLEELFAHIGVMLLNVQQFEWLLERALKLVYADKTELTAQKVFAEDKRTLGMLLTDLRKRASLDSDAGALLASVLHDRNLFVHHLRTAPWFDTATEDGRDRAMDFLAGFAHNLNRAILLLTAIHFKHGEDIGFDSPDMREVKQTEFYREVARYFPYASKVQKKG